MSLARAFDQAAIIAKQPFSRRAEGFYDIRPGRSERLSERSLNR
jgi:hypothetical protein